MAGALGLAFTPKRIWRLNQQLRWLCWALLLASPILVGLRLRRRRQQFPFQPRYSCRLLYRFSDSFQQRWWAAACDEHNPNRPVGWCYGRMT
jgi:hypothetical protein